MLAVPSRTSFIIAVLVVTARRSRASTRGLEHVDKAALDVRLLLAVVVVDVVRAVQSRARDDAGIVAALAPVLRFDFGPGFKLIVVAAAASRRATRLERFD